MLLCNGHVMCVIYMLCYTVVICCNVLIPILVVHFVTHRIVGWLLAAIPCPIAGEGDNVSVGPIKAQCCCRCVHSGTEALCHSLLVGNW